MNSNGNGASVPVSAVVIGVENLDASLGFYANTVGLEVAETRTWQGSAFEQYWNLPAGSEARCAFLEHGADPVGRIQLMEFNAPDRKLVRSPEIRRATGLFNLNLYTSDMAKDYEQLKSQGFNFWSVPARNNFGPAVGETLEAAFDGPDGVVINMIQLLGDDPSTVIGHIVKFIDEYGRTPTGFTSVVTTAHSVFDMEKALAFYYGPLQMTLFIESILEGAETNRALCLFEDARTRSVIVQDDHQYGNHNQHHNQQRQSSVKTSVNFSRARGRSTTCICDYRRSLLGFHLRIDPDQDILDIIIGERRKRRHRDIVVGFEQGNGLIVSTLDEPG